MSGSARACLETPASQPMWKCSYPVLLAVVPIIELQGSDYYTWRDFLPIIALAAALSAAVTIGCCRWFGRLQGALLAAVFILWFCFVSNTGLILTSLLAVGAITVIRRLSRYREPFQFGLGLTALAIGLHGAVNLVLAAPPGARVAQAPPLEVQSQREPDALPDIWWLVLDGYGRADVLRDFGIEWDLADELEMRGFQVADRSHANYSITPLAFASLLNAAYIDSFRNLDPDARTALPVRSAMERGEVPRVLSEAGYRFEYFPADFHFTRHLVADQVNANPLHFTDVTYRLLYLTPLPAVTRVIAGDQAALHHRARRHQLDRTFDLLGRPAKEGPTFTLAHILAPHPSFVFLADGSPHPSPGPGHLSDGTNWANEHQGRDYRADYREQAAWVRDRVAAVVDRIQTSGRPSIIVIHGDHGPRSMQAASAEEDLVEHMAILSAVWSSDGRVDGLHSTITPVNTIRAVLGHALATPVPQLEDRSFVVHRAQRPVGPMDVTEQLASWQLGPEGP